MGLYLVSGVLKSANFRSKLSFDRGLKIDWGFPEYGGESTCDTFTIDASDNNLLKYV